MAADINERIRFNIESHNGARRIIQNLGQACARDNRHIRCLDPAIGQIKTGRCLAAARDPNKHHIRVPYADRALPIIMGQHVMHGIYAPEVIRIHHMLRSAFLTCPDPCSLLQ